MASLTPRDILLTVQTATVSGQTGAIVIPSGFTSVIARADFAAGTGTSPTLDLYIQRGIKDIGTQTVDGLPTDGAYVYDDLAAFTQITTSGVVEWLTLVGGGNNGVEAASDASLTASTVATGPGPIGGVWRLKWVVGGTNPSFAFDVVAQFIP